MTLWAFLCGAAVFGAIIGLVAYASSTLVARRLGHLRGSDRALAVATLVAAAFVAAHLLPAMLGVLGRGSVILTALIMAVACRRLAPAERSEDRPARPPARASTRVEQVLAFVCVGMLTYHSGRLLIDAVQIPITVGDDVSFHLPVVARWLQDGSIWSNVEFLPFFPTGSYPSTGNVVLLGLALPWHSFDLVRLADVPFLGLAGLGGYVASRELRASRAMAVIAACLVLALPIVLASTVTRTLPDGVLFGTFSAGVAWLLRYRRTGRGSELVLAGTALGMAFGSKWYGVSTVPALLGLWGLWRWRAVGLGTALRRDTAIPSIVAALTGGVWFVRNVVVYGNPLWPLKLQLGGLVTLEGPKNVVLERYGFSISDYLGSPGILVNRVWPDLRDALGAPAGLLIVVALSVALALCLSRVRRAPDAAMAGWLVAATMAIVVIYVLTPATATGPRNDPAEGIIGGNSRYVVPAFCCAAPVLAWAVGLLGERMGRILAAASAGAVVAGTASAFVVPAPNAVAEAAALAVLATAGMTVVTHRSNPTRLRWRAPTGWLAVGCLLAGLLVVGRVVQQRVERRGFTAVDPTAAWVDVHAPFGYRIGLAGDVFANGRSLTAGLFGPRLGNTVQIVAPRDHGMFTEYGHSESFRRALVRERVDLLLIGRGSLSRRETAQAQWARQAGYVDVVRSSRWLLLKRAGLR